MVRATRGLHFKAFVHVEVSRNEAHTSSKPTEVFGFSGRVEKHKSGLVVGHQSVDAERRFICWSCPPVRVIGVYTPRFLYFDSCCGWSYR